MSQQHPYQTGFIRWRAADQQFDGWQRSGVALAPDGALRLDPDTAAPDSDPHPSGGYQGRSFYNGGGFIVGEALGPAVPVEFDLSEVLPSWNADTPPGTWIELQARVKIGERWSAWYNMGIWATDSSTIERHSVGQQSDDDARVAVDVLVLKAPVQALQLKLRLFSTGEGATPVVRNLALAFSTKRARPEALVPGDPAHWGRTLAVPVCSQMIYPDGGNVWCSPTSIAMLLAYWRGDGACEQCVRAAVDGVFDWRYDGHGNWPFNIAYAATQGMEAYVLRFSSMRQAEPWIAAGVPLALSYAWPEGGLAGAPIPSSDGHLVVLVGFDAMGNPVINDPAAPSDDAVQRVYDRAELETLWLEHSGGMVYVLHPPDHVVPVL